MRKRTLVLSLLFSCCFHLRAVEVTPELSDEYIFNPGIGWQMLVTAGPSHVKRGIEEMPLVSHYYYRACWTNYETRQEQYEGSSAVRVIDGMQRLCKDAGKYYAFRVVSYNSQNPTYQRTGQQVQGCDTAVPAYIFTQLGAKGFREPGDHNNWVPVFWDPVYIQQFNKLAAFLGKRYASDPSLGYVDIGGGNWGEMNLRNTGVPSLDDLSVWKQNGLTPDAWHDMIVKLVDGYRAAFPAAQIIIAADFGSYGKPETRDYAVKNRIGFRDDGLGMDYSRAGRTNKDFETHWPQALCMFENGYVDWTDSAGSGWGTPENVRSTLEWAIDKCHASIVMVGKGDGAFNAYRQYEPLMKELGKRLGYRLAVTKALYQDPAQSGAAWSIALLWSNLGNAPPYRDYAVEISILKGTSVYYRHVVPPEQARTSTWVPDPRQPHIMKLSLKLPASIPAGKKAVTVALCDPAATDDPALRINLAHKTADEFKRALVGFVDVQARGSTLLSPDGSSSEETAPLKCWPEIEKALAANRYDEALALIKTKSAGADENGRKSLEMLGARAARGNRLIAAVAANPAAVRGQKITVSVAGMKALAGITEVDKTGVQAAAAGMPLTVAWDAVSPFKLYSLAALALPDTPENKLLLAEFLVDIGRPDGAKALLKELKDSPVAKQAADLLQRLD
ncbi:MAG: DUF4832 domain-containing protein [Planctomycetes bacterium]|nr:DUF4832 domain-containing protein [Planctomycetota bacterium]